MARIKKENVRLLKASFSKQEWKALKENAKFKAQLKHSKDTLDDFENLARIGNALVAPEAWSAQNQVQRVQTSGS